MCGLVGYVGEKNATCVCLEMLKKVEYRGYDSSGVAFQTKSGIKLKKSPGILDNLKKKLEKISQISSCCIGHTRWATHGFANEQNAHPHVSENKLVAIVHNGIIENYKELKKELKNVKFLSETDTEVVVQLVGKKVDETSTEKRILEVISNVCKKLVGSFAFAFLFSNQRDKIFFAKRGSPLVLGCGKNENFLSSDVSSFVGYTIKAMFVEDNEIGVLTKEEIKIFDLKLNRKKLALKDIELKPFHVTKGHFETFMEKEITQGSFAMENTLKVLRQNKELKEKLLKNLRFFSNLHIVACGTALNAGMIFKFLIEKELKIPVMLDYASEFRYKNPILDKNSICFFISQSGETADTLASLELARSKKAYCIAITNTPQSRITQLSNMVIPTCAGIEIAVASTKAYVAQISALYYLLDVFFEIFNKNKKYNLLEIERLGKKLENCSFYDKLVDISKILIKKESCFFIGRGLDYYLALEGSLKLKEISYIHCEAFAGGELKHGSLSLLDKSSIVVVLLTQKALANKIMSNINEVKSRGAKVFLITQFDEFKTDVDYYLKLPAAKEILMPFMAIKPLQELAFLCTKEKGLNPDKPRNLAKSVTVE